MSEKKRFRPLRDTVVVERKAAESQTPTGLHLPEDVYDRPQPEGRVIAIGPKVVDIVEGDYVIFGAYAGRDDAEDVVLIKEEDVLAIVRED